MNRRTVLASAIAMLAPATQASAQPREVKDDLEIVPFSSKLFMGIYNSTKPIAELVDTLRFKAVLREFTSELAKVGTAKEIVFDLTLQPGCDDIALSNAGRSLSDRLLALRATTERLGIAVIDPALKAQVDIAVSHIWVVNHGKAAWVPFLRDYCGRSAAGKSEFRSAIRSSIAAVDQCKNDARKLLEKLSA